MSLALVQERERAHLKKETSLGKSLSLMTLTWEYESEEELEAEVELGVCGLTFSQPFGRPSLPLGLVDACGCCCC